MKKKCFKCGIKKDLSKFYKHSEMADGYLGKCKKCAKKDANEYRQNRCKQVKKYNHQRDKLPHRVKARKQYHQKHRKEEKQYREANKKHIAEYRKQYCQTPAGKAILKTHWQNRRSLMKGLTKEIIQQVYEDNIKKYGTLTCCLCFKWITFGDDSLEHLTPLSRGGTHRFKNLGVAHNKCNLQKGTKTLAEWFNLKKF